MKTSILLLANSAIWCPWHTLKSKHDDYDDDDDDDGDDDDEDYYDEEDDNGEHFGTYIINEMR